MRINIIGSMDLYYGSVLMGYKCITANIVMIVHSYQDYNCYS